MNSLDNKKTQKIPGQKIPRLKKSVRLDMAVLPELKPMFKKRGIGDMRLIHDWYKIVGTPLADNTAVDKITYAHTGNTRGRGILHIKTVGAFATELSYQSEYIIQKVNTYLGFQAVGTIKIDQSLPMAYIQKNQADHTQDTKNRPKPRMDIAVIENIEEENIKNSLRRIASFVYNDK